MKKLFVIIDMKEQVARELLSVPINVERAIKTIELADEPATDLCMQCHKPYPCAFWQYCTRDLPQPSVFNVYGGSGRGFTFEKKLNCYREGSITFDSLHDKSLGNIQDMQVACTLDQSEHIDRFWSVGFKGSLALQSAVLVEVPPDNLAVAHVHASGSEVGER